MKRSNGSDLGRAPASGAEKRRAAALPPALQLMRLPGESGPILRCAGELSVATVEALRRELAMIVSLGYPELILNLSGCSSLDGTSTRTVLQVIKQMLEEGRHLAIVTGTGPAARVFQELGAPREFLLFATEESARAALRRGSQRPSGAAPSPQLPASSEGVGTPLGEPAAAVPAGGREPGAGCCERSEPGAGSEAGRNRSLQWLVEAIGAIDALPLLPAKQHGSAA
jgi:anti-anti-sigma factor